MNLMESTSLAQFQSVGQALFWVGLLLVLILSLDILRRGKSFPDVYHGNARIAGRWIRWVWVLALLFSYIAGGRATLYTYYEENGVRQSTPVAIDQMDRETGRDPNATSSTSGMFNLPFYQSEFSAVVYRDGQSRSAANHRIVFPWVFFVFVAGYIWTIRGKRGRGDQLPHWQGGAGPKVSGA